MVDLANSEEMVRIPVIETFVGEKMLFMFLRRELGVANLPCKNDGETTPSGAGNGADIGMVGIWLGVSLIDLHWFTRNCINCL